jgi:hypothetical protein
MEEMKTFVGIDPGSHGAIVALRGTDIRYMDIDCSTNDAIAFLREQKELAEQRKEQIGVVLEYVRAMPKQGVSSTFKFGMIYGELRGACLALGLPIIAEPTPIKWKNRIFGGRITGMEKADQKRMARDKARELYPQSAEWLKRVKDADRAEALLMAHYGTQQAGR